MKKMTRRIGVAAAVALALAVNVSAHETASIGQMRLTVGWGDEPAFSGLRNSVDVDVVDAHGAPVIDPAGSLTAEVAFGDDWITLPLVASRARPGRFSAPLLPTRSGTYTFHITGRLKGQTVEMTSTCSDMTFACVTDVSEIQFPAKDPSAGQLAERLSRTLPRTERAVAAAIRARNLGLLSTAVALAFASAVVIAGRRRRAEA